MSIFIFGDGGGLNPRPYIYYALFILTEVSSQGHLMQYIKEVIIFPFSLKKLIPGKKS